MSLKILFVEEIIRSAVAKKPGQTVTVMDLGCGTAVYMPGILKKYPTVEYVGVEPIEASYQEALKNLAGLANVRVHLQLGYDEVVGETKETFDLVFSQSVLEHVRQLEAFLALGAQYLVPGGVMVHRYDLGHALYPHSLKERAHVWMGNHFPTVLPERQFVRYVPEAEVRALYTKLGLTNLSATYHQMPNHKKLEKQKIAQLEPVIEELFAWEMKHQSVFQAIPLPTRELLFPSVAVWGTR
jgi:cyclopropane fatty-acyl-phospholipid synthase-like methyltransferase